MKQEAIKKEIESLQLKVMKYIEQLSLLCDEDYYNMCNIIEQLELQIKELENRL